MSVCLTVRILCNETCRVSRAHTCHMWEKKTSSESIQNRWRESRNASGNIFFSTNWPPPPHSHPPPTPPKAANLWETLNSKLLNSSVPEAANGDKMLIKTVLLNVKLIVKQIAPCKYIITAEHNEGWGVPEAFAASTPTQTAGVGPRVTRRLRGSFNASLLPFPHFNSTHTLRLWTQTHVIRNKAAGAWELC